MAISSRIKQLIESQNISTYAFEKKIGVGIGTVNKIIKQNSKISGDVLEKIHITYKDISLEWLITGTGEMSKVPYKSTVSLSHIKPSALLDIKSKNDIKPNHIIEVYNIAGFHNADFLIQTNENSMEPTYNRSDLLACKLIEPTFIQWNKTHILLTTQGILIKRLTPDTSEQNYLGTSDNNKYRTITIPKSEVLNMGIIIGALKFE